MLGGYKENNSVILIKIGRRESPSPFFKISGDHAWRTLWKYLHSSYAQFLAACGQSQKEEIRLLWRKQRQVTPTTVYSLEDAQKAVFEISDRVGTITMIFYYKDDVLLNKNL